MSSSFRRPIKRDPDRKLTREERIRDFLATMKEFVGFQLFGEICIYPTLVSAMLWRAVREKKSHYCKFQESEKKAVEKGWVLTLDFSVRPDYVQFTFKPTRETITVKEET